MEPCIKEQKIQAMRNYKRAKFVYNLVLYSLTSIITCFFFSYSFWFPSLDHFLSSLPNSVSFFLNVKCFFILGNLIVLILVAESKFKQPSSSAHDIYDEYVARSRSSCHHIVETSNMPHDEKKKGMRKSKSEVWGESGVIKSRGKKEEVHKEKKMGMRSSKSEVWGESGIIKSKGKKEEVHKSSGHEETKMGMRSSKSDVWGDSGIIKSKGKKDEVHKSSSSSSEHKKIGMRSSKSEIWSVSEKTREEEEEIHKSGVNHEEKRIEVRGESEIMKSKGVCKSSNYGGEKRGMRSSKSAIWGESGITKSNGGEDEEKKMGMRGSKSAIWGESEIVKEEEEEKPYMAKEDLNKRVEAFIARVNNQRLLEAKLVDHGIK